MTTQRHPLYTKFVRLITTIIMFMVSWIPLRLGYWTRGIIYPFILKRMGESVRISTDVELLNANLISLGRAVFLDNNVRLRPMGPNTQIVLGNGVQIDRGTDIKVHYGTKGCIHIDDDTIIGPYCFLSGESITIGKQCLIAPQVGLFANNHEFSDPLRYIRQQGHTYQGIVIEDDCWLGTGVKVLDGVRIGHGSVIGAGAVVSKSLPPYSIAVGVPAKIVATRNENDPPVKALVAETEEHIERCRGATGISANGHPLTDDAEIAISQR